MRGRWIYVLLLSGAAIYCAAADTGWLKKVPEGERARTNPYAGQPDAIAAGKNIYANACARCHGANAEGRKGRPALVGEQLSGATDGQIQWVIKNGMAYKGMPSWGSMPEQQRWQVVAWLRSQNNAGESK